MIHDAGRVVLRVCASTRLFPIATLLAVAILCPHAAQGQSLPSGWTGSNVGAPAIPGGATHSNGTFTVNGEGNRVGNTSDQFYFVQRRVTGDATIVARVTSIENTHRSAKAGVMIRESLTAGSRHGFVLVTPGSGVGFHRRTSTGGSTSGTNVSAAAPVWLRLQRRGSTFTASGSYNGTSWTTIGTATIPMASTVYVGLAVSSYNTTQLATGVFTNVSVTGTTPSGTPPTVSLTSPSAGATYTAPATVNMAANASDSDNGVAQVEFYSNGTLLGTDTTSPYSYSWSGVAAGSYSLTAVARDNAGATTTSAARSITVSGGTSNTPPTVSLTAPAAGSSYVAPASVTISANASDSDGIARVDFYAGSTLVGTDTTSPYSVVWSSAPAGSHSLTAQARDTRGASTTSAARAISITNPSMPTRAIFGASPDHTTVTRYVLDVFTAGANPATAPPVATQNLGKPAMVNGECNVDIATTVGGLPGGNYFATVVAVSPGGTSTRAVSAVFAR